MKIRLLAGLDIVYHGARLILLEFAAGVLLPLALGLLLVLRGRAVWQRPLGVYLLLVALNYLPLLLAAVRLAADAQALQNVRDELARDPQMGVRYTKKSLLILVPLAIPCFALAELMRPRPAR